MNSEVQREGHDEDPQGLRERKKVQTREALVHAARDLFLERGFDSVTVDEIAQMANVSRRTFFRYFATKEAAAFPNRDRWLEQFHALTAQRAGEPAYQTVRRALLGMAGAFMEHRDAMIAQHRIANAATSLIAYQRDVDRVWADVIADALRHEHGGRESRLIAAAMMGVIRATLDEWFAQGALGDLLEMGTEALELVERGVLHGTRAVG
ncbi:MAG: TetR family transcriptional regulator [Sandaracinaceae bacterium]|nr:TetR family transcriptional regulator [Myxococcales bacterium]MCB9661129.1 TetR family transcriptional regulator [Sandaracinaceae bacterium]